MLPRSIRALVALVAVLLFPTLGSSQDGPRRIYVAPDDHTDYLWSADEEGYRKAFVEMLDYYLDRIDATAQDNADHQARFNCDGSYWVWTYESSKPPAAFERLVSRIRDGHISMPLNTLVSAHGGTPAEAVLRGLYYAGALERRYHLRFPLATSIENQTLPFGLGSLWAGAGARYSWKGICGCVTRLDKTAQRPHEIYWWKGLDGSRVLMKWNSLFQGSNQSVGGYAEAYNPAASIEYVDSDPRFRAAYPYQIVGLFGIGWDNVKTLSDAAVEAAKSKTTPSRRVIVSNTVDFFEDFESTYGTRLPALSAAFGNEWELYTASLAEVSGRVRRAVELLRGAEALATVVALKRPEFVRGRETARDRAWRNLGLFWEHDWTADSATIAKAERAAWHRKLASEIEEYVATLHHDAALALGSLIRKKGNAERFYVFNPLGWKRTDMADYDFNGAGPVHVVDTTTGEEVPSQIVRLPIDGRSELRQFLRILATDVPPVGYKVFEVRVGSGKPWPPAAAASGNLLENGVYRLTLREGGAITSLVDKTKNNREFAALSFPDGLTINDLGYTAGTIEPENVGPVSATLKTTGPDPIAHTTRITLGLWSPRIDIRNELTQNFGGTQAWQFSFNLPGPDVWHEEVGAVIRARFLEDGGHYSRSLSRVDWLTLNHFAAMTGRDGVGITLSNSDCAFMKLGKSSTENGVSRLDVNTPVIEVLTGGQVDSMRQGFVNQGGDQYFLQRFALRTQGAFSAPDSMRFAMESQNPLICGTVTGAGPYPEESFSLLGVSDPDVLLWALKPAEEGIQSGIVVRLWNLDPAPREVTLRPGVQLFAARQTSHIETDLRDLPLHSGRLSLRIEGSQMLTFRLLPRNVKN